MDMCTLTIGVESLAETKRRTLAAFRGEADATPRFTFVSPGLMARVLTPLRWSIIEAMTGAGEIGVRELARRLERDVKAVHTDVTALVNAGLVTRTAEGKYLFPYDRVQVHFGFGAQKMAA